MFTHVQNQQKFNSNNTLVFDFWIWLKNEDTKTTDVEFKLFGRLAVFSGTHIFSTKQFWVQTATKYFCTNVP
jgi:hypothetical protein